MDNIYKRADNIDEKIHSVKLPYIAWKVLFLVNGELLTAEIATMLEEEAALVEEALQKLAAEELALAVGQAETAKPEITEEKPEEPEKVVAEVQPESEAEVPEEPDVTEEMVTDEIPAEETIEPEPVVEEVAEIEETPAVTEETVEAEADETGMDLDVDFTEELGLNGEEKPQEEKETETAAPEPPAEEPKIDSEIQGGKKTILVIDDSIVIRKMVEIALEDENYNIQTAVSGKEGLDKIDQINPDLIILDLMLPDISGIDILKTVKASKGLPVIMLSGKDSPQMVENAKSEGADAFLPKPFKDDELVGKIKSLIQE